MPDPGEINIIGYLRATAPRLANALTMERLELIEQVAAARHAGEPLRQAAEKLIADWDDHFDAEGPLEDGRYRSSSAVAPEKIEALRAALEEAEHAGG